MLTPSSVLGAKVLVGVIEMGVTLGMDNIVDIIRSKPRARGPPPALMVVFKKPSAGTVSKVLR